MRQTLPIELWSSVLENAAGETAKDTTTPLLDTSLVPPGSLGDLQAWEPWLSKAQHRQYRKSIRDKCSWGLVSKEWRRIITPILYKYATFKTTKGLLSFFRTVTEYPSAVDRGSILMTKPLGSHTRYLFIEFHATFRPWNDVDAEIIRAASAILINIDVLIVVSPPASKKGRVHNAAYKGVPIVNAILQNGCKVRRYASESSAFIMSPSFPSFVHIEMLTLTGGTGYILPTLPPVPTELPLLHTINFVEFGYDSPFYFMSKCSLPALRRVTVIPSENAYFVPGNQNAVFFATHGQRITSLHVTAWRHLATELLLQQCTVLEDLIIPIDSIPRDQTLTHATLQNIGLYTYIPSRKLDFDQALKKIDVALAEISGLRASLKSVRLVDFEADDFVSYPWYQDDWSCWRKWIRSWASDGIRFEFSNGELVELPEFLEDEEDGEEDDDGSGDDYS
jgi:hypothetical protein